MKINKKAVEINVTTVIIIILAIVVLVVLVLWFTGGLQNLFGSIKTAYQVYGGDRIRIVKDYCSQATIETFCQVKQPLYNTVNKTTDYFYCFEKPIEAKLKYIDPTTNKEITIATRERCEELGYPPSE